jgi:hypothetical protein
MLAVADTAILVVIIPITAGFNILPVGVTLLELGRFITRSELDLVSAFELLGEGLGGTGLEFSDFRDVPSDNGTLDRGFLRESDLGSNTKGDNSKSDAGNHD